MDQAASKREFIAAAVEWSTLIALIVAVCVMHGLGFYLAVILALSLVWRFGEDFTLFMVLWMLYCSIKLQTTLQYPSYTTLHRLVQKNRKADVSCDLEDLYLAVNGCKPEAETLQNMTNALSGCAFMINPQTRLGVRAWLGVLAVWAAASCLPGAWLGYVAFAAIPVLLLYGLCKVVQGVLDVV